MRALLVLSIVLAACGGSPDSTGGGGACPAMDATDAGDLTALAAQRCNVPGSMGTRNWYRLSAMLPGGVDVVQVELWPDRGAFRGGPVQPGTYQLSGADLDYATCGVCLRALADRGLPTEREYFAIAGTVEVTAVGSTADAPFVATVLDASFAEVDSDHSEIESGCSVDLERVQISGSVALMGGTGGGSGGAGAGGSGGCLTTVGD
jgi:hypothetical protein